MVAPTTLLAGFQEALAWEYAPAIQYTRHAGLFDERGLRDKLMAKIAKELHKHALEEMEHAQILSYWIPILGVVASGRPASPVTCVAEIAPAGGDYREMLVADLRGEVDAIARYGRLRQEVYAFGWPEAQRQLIKDLDHVIKVEREHERDLRGWLAEMGG